MGRRPPVESLLQDLPSAVDDKTPFRGEGGDPSSARLSLDFESGAAAVRQGYPSLPPWPEKVSTNSNDFRISLGGGHISTSALCFPKGKGSRVLKDSIPSHSHHAAPLLLLLGVIVKSLSFLVRFCNYFIGCL